MRAWTTEILRSSAARSVWIVKPNGAPSVDGHADPAGDASRAAGRLPRWSRAFVCFFHAVVPPPSHADRRRSSPLLLASSRHNHYVNKITTTTGRNGRLRVRSQRGANETNKLP